MNLARSLKLLAVLLFFLPFQNCSHNIAFTMASYNGTVFDGLQTQNYFVNSSEDAMNPLKDSGDFNCLTVSGKCSLAAAFAAATNLIASSPNTTVVITVEEGTYFVTSRLTLPDGQITLKGQNQATTVIDGSKTANGILSIVSSMSINVQQLTFQNAHDSNQGAAVTVTGGMVQIGDCSFLNNAESGNMGGAIFADTTNLILTHVTLAGNSVVGGNGSALYAQQSTVSMNDINANGNPSMGYVFDFENSSEIITSSSVTNNGGGGFNIFDNSPKYLNMVNATISGNSGFGLNIDLATGSVTNIILESLSLINGGASGNFSSTMVSGNAITFVNSVLANNLGVANCQIAGVSTPMWSNTISSDASCGGTLGSNSIQSFANLKLGVLALNGNSGISLSIMPASGSPLIDAGANGSYCPPKDQRGAPRPVDKLGAGAICDIGAVEVQ